MTANTSPKGEHMSLSGKLEIFPLDEVLRLLARSHQDGCLRVEGDGAGRIYFESGSLTFATVESDEDFRSYLLASGVTSEEGLSRLEVSRGSLTEALVPSAASAALTELVREQCVEALYRIRRPASGYFEFQIESRPRYGTGQSFDVETVLSEAERRAAEWADIETVVPDLGVPWHMVPTIDEESVSISDTAWRFLAALDGSCSVDVLAGRLGLTTFQTARRMAELSRARLVEPVAADEPVAAQPEPHAPPIETPAPPLVGEAPAVAPPAEEAASDEPKQADSVWWEEKEQTPEPAEAADEPAASEETSEEPFLESVFSELESNESESGSDEDDDDSDDDDGGFGLLRRRGLGAAFRELADS